MRRLVGERWRASGGEGARVREVWADAWAEGVSAREVGRVIKEMARAGELEERDGVLHERT